MSTHGVEELKSDRNAFSLEIQSAVRSELELILSSPAFAQSNRCKRFLGFVVTQTLAGHGSELKERTIGISVFERAIDYDTGGDSIVRVTSNEVRKRISQFYQESSTSHPIQIDLPRGSYVPEFRIQPSRKEPAEIAPAPKIQPVPVVPPISATHEHVLDVENGEEIGAANTHDLHLKSARISRRRWIGIALLATVITAAAGFTVWKTETPSKFPQIWDSFLHSNAPVLICLGTHNLTSRNTQANPETERFIDLVLHNEIIPVDDVTVITSMASLLGKKGIPFRVVGAGQTSLTDLRRQPVILIGGVNNRWTLRLTQDLRYRIERVERGQNKDPIALIVDSQSPGSEPWTIDFSVPMYAWKNDYAIIARIDDPTTGVPMLIDAGLGNDGSIAASELLTSDILPNHMKSDPTCNGKTNFEAVIGTEIIDAKPGPPHVLRLQCW